MLKLFRIKGISLEIHYSFAILFFAFVYLLMPVWEFSGPWRFLQKFLVSLLFSFLFFKGVFLHELAHALMMKKEKFKVEKISFFGLGAGAQTNDYFQNYLQEIKISGAGILVSLLISTCWFALFFVCKLIWGWEIYNSAISSFFFFQYLTNLYLVIVNIIPAFPTDGGRILRAIIWRQTNNLIRSTFIATCIAWVISIAMIISLFTSYGSIWYALVGIFIILGSYVEFVYVKTGREIHIKEVIKNFFIKYNKKLNWNMKKSIQIFSLGILFLLPLLFNIVGVARSEVLDKFSVIKIYVRDDVGEIVSEGSGYVINDKGEIKTAYHVIDEAVQSERYIIQVFVDSYYTADVLSEKCDQKNDVAYIKISGNDLNSFKKVIISDSDIYDDEKVTLYGHRGASTDISKIFGTFVTENERQKILLLYQKLLTELQKADKDHLNIDGINYVLFFMNLVKSGNGILVKTSFDPNDNSGMSGGPAIINQGVVGTISMTTELTNDDGSKGSLFLISKK